MEISIDLRTISDGGMVTVRFRLRQHRFAEVMDVNEAFKLIRELYRSKP